ncbi:Uncharacterised protein [Yersinia pseudotuberculosis]|nr:Uncharacterised protein [Yersinia pseudotuberculosis]
MNLMLNYFATFGDYYFTIHDCIEASNQWH